MYLFLFIMGWIFSGFISSLTFTILMYVNKIDFTKSTYEFMLILILFGPLGFIVIVFGLLYTFYNYKLKK